MKRRDFLYGVSATALAATVPALAQPVSPLMTMSGKDSNGADFSLERFANKVCLISFFTGGCNLCTHDLKLMREFNLSNKTKQFALIGVNLDKTEGDFKDYVKLISLTIPPAQRFPLLWRAAAAHQDNFGRVQREPTHFVLDTQHRLSFKREGTFQPDDWDRLWTTISL